jgi:CBS domain-containing protein
MTAGKICNRDTIIVKPHVSIVEAVALMKWYHVGDLVVVEEDKGKRVPVGILTDRDVALAVATHAARLSHLRVDDLMSRGLVTVTEGESLREALNKMQANGIRRLPVVNSLDGALEGIVTFDDIVEELAEELTDMAKLVVREQKKERLRLES